MEIARLIDVLSTLLCGSPWKYGVVAFIILAESKGKGNISNKQTDGKWEHAIYARGNDM